MGVTSAAAGATDSAVKLAGQFALAYASGREGRSIIEYTQPTRVEPVVLVDDKVANLSFTPDLMQSLNSIFAGYYLQAVLLSVNVGRVDVLGLLDQLNPNRNPRAQAARQIGASLEDANSYQFALPYPNQAVGLEHYGVDNPSMEDADDDRRKRARERLREEREDEKYLDDKEQRRRRGVAGATDTGDSLKGLREANNLSVGKQLEVEIESNGQKAKFMINVRLIVSTAPSTAVVHTLSLGQNRRTAKERWHGWRSGQLRFVRDILLAQDAIDHRRKGQMTDPAGIFADNIKRRRNNRISAILTGRPSIATASNIVVISESTCKELEREIRGRIEDFRTRERLFKETASMILAVVDPEWEQVTIYHRSIDKPTELSAGDLKSGSSSKNTDVAEILRAYAQGKAPSV